MRQKNVGQTKKKLLIIEVIVCVSRTVLLNTRDTLFLFVFQFNSCWSMENLRLDVFWTQAVGDNGRINLHVTTLYGLSVFFSAFILERPSRTQHKDKCFKCSFNGDRSVSFGKITLTIYHHRLAFYSGTKQFSIESIAYQYFVYTVLNRSSIKKCYRKYKHMWMRNATKTLKTRLYAFLKLKFCIMHSFNVRTADKACLKVDIKEHE